MRRGRRACGWFRGQDAGEKQPMGLGLSRLRFRNRAWSISAVACWSRPVCAGEKERSSGVFGSDFERGTIATMGLWVAL